MIRLFITVMLLVVPIAAFALPSAHDPAQNISTVGGLSSCTYNCHASGRSIAKTDVLYAKNVCLKCHADAPLMGGTIKKFGKNDWVDLTGVSGNNTTLFPSRTPNNTSHKWFGPDVVPSAGAVAPTASGANGMTRTGYTGSLSCGRCHSVHGNSDTNSSNKPYLRQNNENDQMCRNCHSPRDQKTTIAGSHPVNVSYSSAVRKNPTKYLATPITNTAEFNTPGGVPYNFQLPLKNALVQCSTCHGVHNTDSRTSTFDPYSTTNIFGLLSSSKGYLLRVSARGPVDTQVNICTNCHSGKKTHDTRKQNVQCNDCHSGHVEYDPIATTGTPNNGPNIHLVRRYMQYTSAGRVWDGNPKELAALKKRVIFNDGTNKVWYNVASKAGLCATCHKAPTSHFNEAGTVFSYGNGTTGNIDCTLCHTHDAEAGSFSEPLAVLNGDGCASCHGQPPQVNSAVVGSGGRDSHYDRYTDESSTPHISHSGSAYAGYSCNECHAGQAPGHSGYSATYQGHYVFTDLTESKAGLSATYTAAATGATPAATAASTCNNVYCHSKGDGTYKGSNAAMQWNIGMKGLVSDQSTSVRCVYCHDSDGLSGRTLISTGSHSKHVSSAAGSMSYSCKICHALTVSDNQTVKDFTRHVNTDKDVYLLYSGAATGKGVGVVKGNAGAYFDYVTAAKSCANFYCHSDGKGAAPVTTPVWGTQSSGLCNTCHLTSVNGSKLATGDHTYHIGTSVDYSTCVTCHGYTTETAASHVNGTVEVVTSSCGAVAGCHGKLTPPTWASTTVDSCTKCHGTPTATASLSNTTRYLVAPVGNSTDPHQKHLTGSTFTNYSTADFRCQGCHGTLPTDIKHAAIGNATISFNGMATGSAANRGSLSPIWNSTDKTCANTYCHNPAAANSKYDAGTGIAPAWNDSAYITGTSSTRTVAKCEVCHLVPGSTGFSKASAHSDVVITDSCAKCHTHDGDTTGTAGQRHMDGFTYGNGDCNACHGYPPMTQAELDARVTGEFTGGALSDKGGYHKQHLNSSITVKDANPFTPCLPCHPDASKNQHQNNKVDVFYTPDATDTINRLDGTRVKRYGNYSAAAPAKNFNRTCTNVSCHFQTSPKWY